MEVDFVIVGKIDRFRKILYFILLYVDFRFKYILYVNSRGGV